MAKGAATRNAAIFLDLRADILAGRLKPGERLTFAELCARYEASVGVVREALTRLTEQGLAQAEPQQGFRVTTLSAEDLRVLTEARINIETLTLKFAVQAADVSWESKVLAAHHTLSRTPQTEPGDPHRISDEWASAHSTFHETMLDGCPNVRLKGIAASLRDSAELYRRWSVAIGEGPRDIGLEHRELLEAVLKRDEDLAIRRLTSHISHTTQLILDAIPIEEEVS
jgi:DNA-binding GntR family transcriptional regulator